MTDTLYIMILYINIVNGSSNHKYFVDNQEDLGYVIDRIDSQIHGLF